MSKFVKFEAQVDGYLPELSVKVDNILMVTIDDVYFTQGGELKERETQDWNNYSTWNFECITSQIEELSTDEWIDLSVVDSENKTKRFFIRKDSFVGLDSENGYYKLMVEHNGVNLSYQVRGLTRKGAREVVEKFED